MSNKDKAVKIEPKGPAPVKVPPVVEPVTKPQTPKGPAPVKLPS
ncbi:hypothetical protein [Pseudomonas gingeri]|nr:hypothetical protein [Pseudomonas gingeri]